MNGWMAAPPGDFLIAEKFSIRVMNSNVMNPNGIKGSKKKCFFMLPFKSETLKHILIFFTLVKEKRNPKIVKELPVDIGFWTWLELYCGKDRSP